ncbi:hypothetical protein M3Y99_01076600 [Aphelenchoides fujianensis]|nr:hypothetical protein M3Y99_01076600 [Aphelenchoides fujianensis]
MDASAADQSELMERFQEMIDGHKDTPAFHAAIREFADSVGLKDVQHPDPLVLLQAAIAFVHNVLDAQGEQALVEGVKIDLEKMPLGVKSTGSPQLDLLIKQLRLLNVAQLRQLQTDTNVLIVDVQKKIADPKTDLYMGKHGR